MTSTLIRFLLALAVFVQSMSALTANQIADHFRRRLSSGSGVYLPSDPNYSQETTERWNTYIVPSYALAVRPALVSDVQKVIKYARRHNVPFLTTGGGHGYIESLSTVKNAINLDLGLFKDFTVDRNANTLTAGGSLRFSNVTQALQDAGKDMPVASCACAGMMGVSMGGGIGPYVGLYGLISDQILSFEIVTGTGDVLNVSAASHPDLFWGLKGAGFNFGVVTKAVYRIHDAHNGGQVTNADLTFPGSKNESVWTAVAKIAVTQPKELHLSASIAFNTSNNTPMIIVNGIFAGDTSQARTILKPLLDLDPVQPNITLIPWVDLATAPVYGLVAGGCLPSGETDFSANLRTLEVHTLVSMTNFVAKTQATSVILAKSITELTIPGKAIGEGVGRGDNATSFPYRSVAGFVQIQAAVPSKEDAEMVEKWGAEVRGIAQAGSGFPSLQVYVNTAHGDEGEAGWYTERNLGPLHMLKDRYDPDGLFDFYAPIS